MVDYNGISVKENRLALDLRKAYTEMNFSLETPMRKFKSLCFGLAAFVAVSSIMAAVAWLLGMPNENLWIIPASLGIGSFAIICLIWLVWRLAITLLSNLWRL